MIFNLLITSLICLFSFGSVHNNYDHQPKEEKQVQNLTMDTGSGTVYEIQPVVNYLNSNGLDLWRYILGTQYYFGNPFQEWHDNPLSADSFSINISLSGTSVGNFYLINYLDYLPIVNGSGYPPIGTLVTHINFIASWGQYANITYYYVQLKNNSSVICTLSYVALNSPTSISYTYTNNHIVTAESDVDNIRLCFSGLNSCMVFSKMVYNNQDYTSIYQSGFDNGSKSGYTTGYDEGFTSGLNEGKQTGFTEGVLYAQSQNQTALTIFTGIIDVGLLPINVFLAMFNYEVFGINIAGLVSSLLTVAIVVIVIRIFTGGSKND